MGLIICEYTVLVEILCDHMLIVFDYMSYKPFLRIHDYMKINFFLVICITVYPLLLSHTDQDNFGM